MLAFLTLACVVASCQVPTLKDGGEGSCNGYDFKPLTAAEVEHKMVNNHIVAKVKVNGVDLWLTIDSGAIDSALTRKAWERCKFDRYSDDVMASWSLGEAKGEWQFFKMDRRQERFFAAPETGIDGHLGSRTLEDMRVGIDPYRHIVCAFSTGDALDVVAKRWFGSQKVETKAGATWIPWSSGAFRVDEFGPNVVGRHPGFARDYVSIELTWSGNSNDVNYLRFGLPLQIDGVRINCMLDTGSPVTIVDRALLNRKAKGNRTTSLKTFMGNFGGEFQVVKALRFGDSGIGLKNTQVMFFDREPPMPNSIMGLVDLMQFKSLLCLGDRRLLLAKRLEGDIRELTTDELWLYDSKAGQYLSMSPGSSMPVSKDTWVISGGAFALWRKQEDGNYIIGLGPMKLRTITAKSPKWPAKIEFAK